MNDSKLEALYALRSYLLENSSNEDSGPSQDDHDEAHGLAIAACHLAKQYGYNCADPDFLDHLDALNGHNDDSEEGRAFAAALPFSTPHPGMQLVASKKNPKVRRWIRVNAAKNVLEIFKNTAAKGVGIAAGGMVGSVAGGKSNIAPAAAAAGLAVAALHNAARRQIGLKNASQSAMTAEHYLKHHKDFLAKHAEKHGVRKETLAHALAYHAIAEHHRQSEDAYHGGKMGNGKPHPIANSGISDEQYHKNLAGRAKSAFIKGVISETSTGSLHDIEKQS